MKKELEKIRILAVGHEALSMSSLMRVIELYDSSIQVVGITKDMHQTIEAVGRLCPDVIVIDLHNLTHDGPSLVSFIRSIYPSIKFLVLYEADDIQCSLSAVANGANGCLSKDISPEEIVVSIRALWLGTIPLSQSILSLLLESSLKESCSLLSHDKSAIVEEGLLELKPIERRLLIMLSHGYTNKELAYHMNLAEQTVKNYLSVIYEKMGVHTRTQAVKIIS
jgi:DNA-binding NarL/FixJ family response regulator